jgi:hypothetical protein
MSKAIEIDGPPISSFKVTNGVATIELRYRSLRVHGDTEEQVREWMDAALTEIGTWCFEHDAFVIWRRRPIVEYYPADQFYTRFNTETEDQIEMPAHWQGFARLITSIPLPLDMWERFETREGEPARQLSSS